MKFQYRIDTEWANSGIQVRSRRLNGHRVGGYQPDIAHAGWITGIMYEEAGRGVLARRGEKVVIDSDGQRQAARFADEDELGEHIRPRGEWNDYHVIAKGNRIVTKINGQTMHELIDDAPQASASGLIAFQLHGGPPMTIRFRNIRLKEDTTPSSSNPTKKVVLIAGSPSHGYGGHEHYAGLKLLGERRPTKRKRACWQTVYHAFDGFGIAYKSSGDYNMIQCFHPYWRSNNREWIELNSPLAQTAHPRPSLASCIRIKVKTPDPFMRHPGNLRGILTRWDKQAVNPEYDKARAAKF